MGNFTWGDANTRLFTPRWAQKTDQSTIAPTPGGKAEISYRAGQGLLTGAWVTQRQLFYQKAHPAQATTHGSCMSRAHCTTCKQMSWLESLQHRKWPVCSQGEQLLAIFITLGRITDFDSLLPWENSCITLVSPPLYCSYLGVVMWPPVFPDLLTSSLLPLRREYFS